MRKYSPSPPLPATHSALGHGSNDFHRNAVRIHNIHKPHLTSPFFKGHARCMEKIEFHRSTVTALRIPSTFCSPSSQETWTGSRNTRCGATYNRPIARSAASSDQSMSLSVSPTERYHRAPSIPSTPSLAISSQNFWTLPQSTSARSSSR